MTPKGYEVVSEAVKVHGLAVSVLPRPAENEDVRFVQVGPASVTDTLNRLTEAGLIERHGPSDAVGSETPAFRVLSINRDLVYLEDTNSRSY